MKRQVERGNWPDSENWGWLTFSQEIWKKYFKNTKIIFHKYERHISQILRKYERNIAQIWKWLNLFFFPFTLWQSNIFFHFFTLLKGQWLEWTTFVNCARVFAQRLQGNFAIFWTFKDFVPLTFCFSILSLSMIPLSAHKVFGIISSFCLFGLLCQFPQFPTKHLLWLSVIVIPVCFSCNMMGGDMGYQQWQAHYFALPRHTLQYIDNMCCLAFLHCVLSIGGE